MTGQGRENLSKENVGERRKEDRHHFCRMARPACVTEKEWKAERSGKPELCREQMPREEIILRRENG